MYCLMRLFVGGWKLGPFMLNSAGSGLLTSSVVTISISKRGQKVFGFLGRGWLFTGRGSSAVVDSNHALLEALLPKIFQMHC